MPAIVDSLAAFIYFGVPTAVGLIGLAAVKLHERTAPSYAEGVFPRPGSMFGRSDADTVAGLAGEGTSVSTEAMRQKPAREIKAEIL